MWLETVITTLGPAGLGALVGGLTGAGGAVIAGVITAVSASRREGRSRLFGEQKAVYADYLQVIRHLQTRLIKGDEAAGDGPSGDLVRNLEIIASKRVRKSHSRIMPALNALLAERKRFIESLTEEEKQQEEPLPPDPSFLAAHKNLERALSDLETAMRRDLGVR